MKSTIRFVLLFLMLQPPLVSFAITSPEFSVTQEPILSESSAIIETNLGNIVIRFFESDSPLSVAQFKSLVMRGWYKDKSFYRIVPGLLVKAGGGLKRDLSGIMPLKGEFTNAHKRGTLSFARKKATTDIEENYVEIEDVGKVPFHKPVTKIKIHNIALLESN